MLNTNLVIIGVSTGGPLALKALLQGLPPVDAPVVIILHIKPGMDAMIVRGLQRATPMPVTLATDGELLQAGHVYLAPGGYHLHLEGNHRVALAEGERVNFVMPSADVAMLSLRRQQRGKLIGIIMTGMGKDGAAGIRHVKELGGMTIAQDQPSSAVFGMPRAAIATGAIDLVLNPAKMALKITELLSHK